MIPAESCTPVLFRTLAEGMLQARPGRPHSCPGQLPSMVSMSGIDVRASHALRRGILWCSAVTALNCPPLRRPKHAQSAPLGASITPPPLYSVSNCVRKLVRSATSPADYRAGSLRQFQSEETGHSKPPWQHAATPDG